MRDSFVLKFHLDQLVRRTVSEHDPTPSWILYRRTFYSDPVPKFHPRPLITSLLAKISEGAKNQCVEVSGSLIR
jgi:hypothetical protein